MNLDRLSEGRIQKFKEVISKRQLNLTVILENVHDPHNIGAVMRTCDSIGVHEIFVVYSDPNLNQDRLELSHTTSSGARKWLDIHFYTALEPCMTHVRSKYDKIYTTHLSNDATDLYDLDLTQSVALFFGNERDGLTEEALQHSDGNFIIPQVGMVQSLNISVACAVSLFEAYRQRNLANMYTENSSNSAAQQAQLFESYYERHTRRFQPHSTEKLNK